MGSGSALTLFDRAPADWHSIPGIEITSAEYLNRVIQSFAMREAGIVELLSANGNRLQVGVGGGLCCVQFIKADNLPPYYCVNAQNPIPGEHEVEFLLGGTPTPVSRKQCLSLAEALDISTHFVSTGDWHPGFQWVPV